MEFDEGAEDYALVVGPSVFVSWVKYGLRLGKGAYSVCPLFLQSSVNPSLMVPLSLMNPAVENQFHRFSASWRYFCLFGVRFARCAAIDRKSSFVTALT